MALHNGIRVPLRAQPASRGSLAQQLIYECGGYVRELRLNAASS
jgi:hypothetical protein